MSGTSFEWNGDIVNAMIAAQSIEAVNRAAEQLMSDSRPLAPKDQGYLRGSGQVTPATPGNPTAYVSYDTPYAARQHEELDWQHDDGQAKYLEQPLIENAETYKEIMNNHTFKGLT